MSNTSNLWRMERLLNQVGKAIMAKLFKPKLASGINTEMGKSVLMSMARIIKVVVLI